MAYNYREVETRWGGLYRVGPGGLVTVVRRDFGLTTEPECSDEAHAQIDRWLKARQLGGLYPPLPFTP